VIKGGDALEVGAAIKIRGRSKKIRQLDPRSEAENNRTKAIFDGAYMSSKGSKNKAGAQRHY